LLVIGDLDLVDDACGRRDREQESEKEDSDILHETSV
jgi:hypothetical protein